MLAFIKNADSSGAAVNWSKMLGEISKDPANVGALSRFMGNMSKTPEGREAMTEFLIKGSSTPEGAKSMAKLFDQSINQP